MNDRLHKAGRAGRRMLRPRKLRSGAAFTLIELLIVIALSALLLALLFAPIIQGLRVTNRSRAFVQAQEATRNGLALMERELGEATYVFDNTNTPILLPLENGTTVTRMQNGGAIYASTQPNISYGRIDFIPSATNSDVNASTTVELDPTTGAPVGGATTLLPGAAAPHRYVRYFIGLTHNLQAGGTAADYYRNIYVFPQSGIDTSGTFNPFVLYRAEYDPHDPNLVAQSASGPVINSTASGDGSLNDPAFFYNTNAASTTDPLTGNTGSGTYAANWAKVATPVLSGANLDMLTWQRGTNGLIDANSPYHLGALFTPGTVVGDTAAPGFKTNPNAEKPAAIPTLYTSKSGEWTLPFTINVYRGVGNANAAAAGSESLQFAYDTNGNLVCSVLNATGVFAPAANSTVAYFCIFSRLTGRYFVSTPGLNLTIDPVRGRIETGLPPIGVTSSGQLEVFMYDANNNLGTSATAFNGSTSPTITVIQGELEETVYRSTTLDTYDAGQTISTGVNPNQPTQPGLVIPADQGILFVDLSLSGQTGLTTVSGYFPTTLSATPINSGGIVNGSALVSPFTAFSGAVLALGTESVMGPDNNGDLYSTSASTNLTVLHPYFRIGANDDLGKTVDSPPQGGGLYTRTSALNYELPPQSDFTSEPIIDFADGVPNSVSTPAALQAYQQYLAQTLPAGLPVPHVTLPPSSTTPPAEVQITYLWQDNFARNPTTGYPIDVSGHSPFDAGVDGQIVPQADVFSVDYGTRSVMQVGLSVEVYDSTSGQAQLSQVSDKIKIQNAVEH